MPTILEIALMGILIGCGMVLGGLLIYGTCHWLGSIALKHFFDKPHTKN